MKKSALETMGESGDGEWPLYRAGKKEKAPITLTWSLGRPCKASSSGYLSDLEQKNLYRETVHLHCNRL